MLQPTFYSHVTLPGDTLGDKQKQTLNEVSRGCHAELDKLNSTLVDFQEIGQSGPDASGLRKKGRRVWERFVWDQEEIGGFRDRISDIIDVFNLFLTNING